ncbi:hypothetical protein B0H12DRAFT_1146558, partial [Mycena haematopus]
EPSAWDGGGAESLRETRWDQLHERTCQQELLGPARDIAGMAGGDERLYTICVRIGALTGRLALAAWCILRRRRWYTSRNGSSSRGSVDILGWRGRARGA